MSGISLTNNSGGITPVNPDIEFIQGNDGINVGPNPTTHIALIVGDNTQGVNTSGNAGTYTETITMFNATTSQKGVTLLASNAETIAGTVTTKVTTPDDIKAKLGVQTLHGIPYGNATTGTIQWLAEATDGQIPIGDTGGVPILGNITSSDGSITVTNSAGSIDLSATRAKGTTSTTNAVTGNILSVPLGAVAGTFQFEARVKAFESTGPAGAGYNIYATFVTDGVSATLVGNQDIFNEDVSLTNADAYFIASGNNAILQVLGVAGLTISWAGETQIT
jgi:hypothetical protein